MFLGELGEVGRPGALAAVRVGLDVVWECADVCVGLRCSAEEGGEKARHCQLRRDVGMNSTLGGFVDNA